jgi:hypothetical protein
MELLSMMQESRAIFKCFLELPLHEKETTHGNFLGRDMSYDVAKLREVAHASVMMFDALEQRDRESLLKWNNFLTSSPA